MALRPEKPRCRPPVSFPSGRRGPAACDALPLSDALPGAPPSGSRDSGSSARLPASACREVLLLDHKSLRTEAVAILPHRLELEGKMI